MILKWLFDLLRVLNSNKHTGEVAAGFSFGIMLTLIPGGNLLWALLFVIGFFTRLNLMTAFLTLGLGKLIVPLVDPLLDAAGYLILTNSSLRPLFTALHAIPLIPLTDFNNTIVMGGFVISLILAFPLWILFKQIISLYRTAVRDRLRSTKLVRHVLKLPAAGKIALLVRKYRSFTGRG